MVISGHENSLSENIKDMHKSLNVNHISVITSNSTNKIDMSFLRLYRANISCFPYRFLMLHPFEIYLLKHL